MAEQDAAREEHIREMYRNRRENGAIPGPYDDLGAPVSRIARTRHGPMLYVRHDLYIGRSLELYGEYAQLEIDVLLRCLRPGDRVIDAGANIGVHTLAFARAVGPAGRVIAFEPQQPIFQVMCANMAMNGLQNVVALPYAVSDTGGALRMPRIDLMEPQNTGSVKVGGDKGLGRDPVLAIALDSLAVQRLALIKIDVEDMEIQVLKGAAGLIRKFRPAIMVEYRPNTDCSDLIRTLRGYGYGIWTLNRPMFNPDNFNGVTENVFHRTYSHNLLCLHPEGRPILTDRDLTAAGAPLPEA